MKPIKLLLFLLFISTNLLHAQTNFKPGYIVTQTGDTVYGEIDYRGGQLMATLCKFKGSDGTISKYSPNDISLYRFIDSKYFVSRELEKQTVFLELLIEGKVRIYYMRDVAGDHYYIDKEGERLAELPYVKDIRIVDGTSVYYESKKHLGILYYYMKDAPNFKSRINRVYKPERKSLIELAEDYQNAVCSDEKCEIYSAPLPSTRVHLEHTIGFITYPYQDEIGKGYNPFSGITAHFWMPKVNEKMYFRTGLVHLRVEYEGKKYSTLKIPLQLEYISPVGKIRPRAAYGLALYGALPQCVAFNLGANIKLSDTFFLSASSDIEFYSTKLIIPRQLFGYSFQAGLFVYFK